ncbi:hypothetical protein Q5762_13920 [Streptomyces sp. P9(2023)]|uniref:hypothetical protein n=1 Tax=Streptomyces sp. P9(2023) TaxID=3064394 RepID=UPI0028F430EE|nr:hypothetical protein [Streptomyces sp. P9(2023)]MDT9689414.1 hypothetical protein [Streptomyces sp. P9(2023)]
MTDQEIQLLVLGGTLGAYVMLLLQLTFAAIDDRRDRRRAQAAAARALKAHAVRDWRDVITGEGA